MSKINAEIVADSVNVQGDRLTSVLVTMPRIILSEMNTHRMLSKNTSSSRAIPFNKMVETIKNDPFIPIAWQKEHKGMQGSDYFTESEAYWNNDKWLKARDYAVKMATIMNEGDITKQLCNRLLEPFMWHTVLISGTEWENFFALRCSQYRVNDTVVYRSRKDFLKNVDNDLFDIAYGKKLKEYTDLDWRKANSGMADIHMMDLAEAMWDAYNESTPKHLKEGDWHIPFGDDVEENYQHEIAQLSVKELDKENHDVNIIIDKIKVKVATARCARVSYTVVGEEKKQSLEADLKLHDKFFDQRPFHASPFEHCAKVMTDDEYQRHINGVAKWEEAGGGFSSLYVGLETKGWCKNYRGFIQYRAMFDFENVPQPAYPLKQSKKVL